MVNKQKIKGSRFEKDIEKTLINLIPDSTWKRVPGSGALGTLVGENELTGDISGRVPGFPKRFRGECKTGYSNKSDGEAKSFSLKKLWLDKIKKEAQGTYSFPVLFGHFENARTGVKSFAVMDLEDFALMMNLFKEMNDDTKE